MVKKTLRAARAPVTKSYAENDSFIDEIIDGFTNPHQNLTKNAKSLKYVQQSAAHTKNNVQANNKNH